jgi:vacuole morphology and inheritance protein 14
MIPATPALIPAILPNLAHPFAAIQTAAGDTNINLYRLIKSLPSPSPTTNTFQSPTSATDAHSSHGFPPPAAIVASGTTAGRRNSVQTSSEAGETGAASGLASSTSTIKGRDIASSGPTASGPAADGPTHGSKASTSTLGSIQPQPMTPNNAFSFPSIPSVSVGLASMAEEDPFDYQATVNVLTLQFLSEYEDTRIAALEWLIMLQQKAPKKVRIPSPLRRCPRSLGREC